MACEDSIGRITISQKVINKGKVFGVNEQYCYKSIIQREKGCGCGGNKKKIVNFYVVEENGIEYEINAKFAVETNDIDTPIGGLSYEERISHIGDNYNFSFQDLLIKPNPDEILERAQIVRM